MDEDARSKLEAKMKKSAEPCGLEGDSSKRFEVRPKAMGLKPGYSYDKVWELIEQVECPDYK